MTWGIVFKDNKRHVIRNRKVGLAYRWGLAQEMDARGSLSGMHHPSLGIRISTNYAGDYEAMLRYPLSEPPDYQKIFKRGCTEKALRRADAANIDFLEKTIKKLTDAALQKLKNR